MKKYKEVKIGNQIWMAENLNIEVKGSWTHPDDPSGEKFGRYYNAAKKAVPNGWHLPSDSEWQKLIDYLGGNKVAGKELKDGPFHALFSGYRSRNGGFYNMGSYAYFWSSSQYGATAAWYRCVGSSDNEVSRYYYYKSLGLCIRCVKD